MVDSEPFHWSCDSEHSIGLVLRIGEAGATKNTNSDGTQLLTVPGPSIECMVDTPKHSKGASCMGDTTKFTVKWNEGHRSRTSYPCKFMYQQVGTVTYINRAPGVWL